MSDNNVKKTIKIGDDLINPYKRRGGSGKGKKTMKVRKPASSSNTFKLTSTKRELLNRIKEKREEERKKNRALNIVLSTSGKGPEEKDNKKKAILDEKNFESGFNDALSYLNKVRQEHREKKMKKKKRKGLGEGLVMEVGGSSDTSNNSVVTSSSSSTGKSTSTSGAIKEKVSIASPPSSSSPSASKISPPAAHASASPEHTPAEPAAIPVGPISLPSAPENLIVINTNSTSDKPNPSVIPSIPNPPPTRTAPPSSYQNETRISPPAYGNLKGGTLPTYRAYHRTLRNRNSLNNNGDIHSSKPRSNDHRRGGKRFSTKSRQVKKKTIKKTYHLGRNKANNQFAVLIKNNDKNRRIKEEENIIKNKPMHEVKSYLYDKNMIKIGTNAPDVVLRKMYETSILAGDITNRNPKIRLHNFTNSSISN